jgi:ATP-dependent DNA helicase RecG
MALNKAEIQHLLLDIETDRVERKESLSSGAKKKVAEAICAFSNDFPNYNVPGVIFIGVDDEGKIIGLPITDQLLLDISSLRSDGNILPLPQMVVQKLTLVDKDGQSGEVAVAEIAPSLSPPVRYEGRCWIRVGPRRAVASRDEERILSEKRRFRDLPFDAIPLESASLSDIDLTSFERMYLPSAVAPDILEENGRSIKEQLASMRFYSLSADSPTAAGILISGKTARDFIPGAYIQFLRLDGTELADPIIDQREISGDLVDVLRQLDDVLRANIRTAADISSRDTEIKTPDYPFVALQQLIRNAVLHRNYESSSAPIRLTWFSDRVEILSPGGPYGQVTMENFGRSGITDYRNPTIAEAMKNLGFVQRFGVGIATARRLLSNNGNPGLEFDIQSQFILATINSVNLQKGGEVH